MPAVKCVSMCKWTQWISCHWCYDLVLRGQGFNGFIFSLQAACSLFAISTPVMHRTVHLPWYSHPVKPNPAWQHLCKAFSHPCWFVFLSLFLNFFICVDFILVSSPLQYNLLKRAWACIYLLFVYLFESVHDCVSVCLCTRIAVQKS